MTRWIVGVIVVAVAAIGVIVVVASGSESEPEAAGPDAEAMAEFRDCMSEHGAELPEPPSGGELPAPPSGVPPGEGPPSFDQQGGAPPAGVRPEASEETQQAMEACSDLMPEGSGVFIAPGGPPGAVPIPQD